MTSTCRRLDRLWWSEKVAKGRGSVAKPGGARPAGAPSPANDREGNRMPERKQASGRTGRGLAPVRRGRKSPLRPSPGQFRFLERKAFSWSIESGPSGPFCMISTKLTGFLSAPQQIHSSTFCSRNILDSLAPDWLGKAGTWLPCFEVPERTRTLCVVRE
jgi:hypothetical protein